MREGGDQRADDGDRRAHHEPASVRHRSATTVSVRTSSLVWGYACQVRQPTVPAGGSGRTASAVTASGSPGKTPTRAYGSSARSARSAGDPGVQLAVGGAQHGGGEAVAARLVVQGAGQVRRPAGQAGDRLGQSGRTAGCGQHDLVGGAEQAQPQPDVPGQVEVADVQRGPLRATERQAQVGGAGVDVRGVEADQHVSWPPARPAGRSSRRRGAAARPGRPPSRPRRTPRRRAGRRPGAGSRGSAWCRCGSRPVLPVAV